MYKVMVKNNFDIRLFATTDSPAKAMEYTKETNADASWIVDADYRLIYSTHPK